MAKKERARELSKVCESAASFCCCCEKIVYRLILKGGEPLLCHRDRKLGTDLQTLRKKVQDTSLGSRNEPRETFRRIPRTTWSRFIDQRAKPQTLAVLLCLRTDLKDGGLRLSVRGLRSRFRCCWCSSCSRSFTAAH